MRVPSGHSVPIAPGSIHVQRDGDRVTLHFDGTHQAVALPAETALAVATLLQRAAGEVLQERPLDPKGARP